MLRKYVVYRELTQYIGISLLHRVGAGVFGAARGLLRAPLARLRGALDGDGPPVALVFAHEGGEVLTCGADFLCLPVRWSGRFVWRLRFAKPADFLLFLLVAPIVVFD